MTQKSYVVLFMRGPARTGRPLGKIVLDKCIKEVYNKGVERMVFKMKNLYEVLDTETLNWMDYKYEHCDSRCEECPCRDAQYGCSYIHDQIRRELNLRGE